MRNALQIDTGPQAASHADDFIVRKASMLDIHLLLDLVNRYAAQGIMLPRTEFEISENIRDFTLILSKAGVLLGCGALHFYSPTSGEVRSLAGSPEAKGRGIGRVIVEALEVEARTFQLHTMFAFTYVDKFFQKLGFMEVERGELPLKAWKDCLRCPKFQCCDEIAMIKYLTAKPERSSPEIHDSGLVSFPILKH
jgi:amino-acid N-acetyltransferase